jgi:hypothetical protein
VTFCETSPLGVSRWRDIVSRTTKRDGREMVVAREVFPTAVVCTRPLPPTLVRFTAQALKGRGE